MNSGNGWEHVLRVDRYRHVEAVKAVCEELFGCCDWDVTPPDTQRCMLIHSAYGVKAVRLRNEDDALLLLMRLT